MVNVAYSGQILVVDRHREWREELAELLRNAGYKVWVVDTSSNALRLAEKTEFDLAVIDIGMPFVDGADLFKRLRWRCPRIRGIFLTEESFRLRNCLATSVTDSVGGG